MVGFVQPPTSNRRACEICGKVIEGTDPTDFMVKYGIHLRSHRLGGQRTRPPEDSVDRFN